MARGRKAGAGKDGGIGGQLPAEGDVPLTMPYSMNPNVKTKWQEIVPIISARVTLTAADSDAIRQYCEMWVIREKAFDELLDPKTKITHSSPNGALQTNPLLKVISQCDGILLKLSERFGLDPASRKRLGLGSAASGEGGDGGFGAFAKGKPNAEPELEGDDVADETPETE